MDLEYKSFPAELKTLDEGPGFEGLAAAFHNIDDTRDIIAPGAFLQDLPEFLASGFVGGLNHNWDEPIGRPVAAEERPEGLFGKAVLSDTQRARDVRTLMKDGVVKRLSIGYKTLAAESLDAAGVLAYWETNGYVPGADDLAKAQDGARLLTRIRLYEFSPVAVPANRQAVVTAVKGLLGDGLPYGAYSDAVVDTLEEWAARTKARLEMRAKDGRPLSAANRDQLRRACDRLKEVHGDLSALHAATEPKPKAADEAEALYARFLAEEARRLGVPVTV